MNDYDKNNLQFIMNLSADEFGDWYATLSDDDCDYAIELLKTARAEIAMQVVELADNVNDVSDAANVLSKFTLKGKA